MATETTILIDQESMDDAIAVLADCADPDAIPALDPQDLPAPVILRPDSTVLDGNHRIVGVAKWMMNNNYDLENDFVEIAAIQVTQAEMVSHPMTSTPESWANNLLVGE